jgi:hypothetical protein
MLARAVPPSGFIEPCLPSPGEQPPTGPDWVHEIKHDGYRLMARRDSLPVGIRLLTMNGHDWSSRYPLIVQAVNKLKARSCLIDGEAVCCDEHGVPAFEMLRHRGTTRTSFSSPSICWTRRQRLAARAARGAQADAGQPAARISAGGAVQPASRAWRRRRVRARLQDGA